MEEMLASDKQEMEKDISKNNEKWIKILNKSDKVKQKLAKLSKILQNAGQNFRLDQKIGEGGYAVAYKATDLKTNTSCVIKKMNLEGFSEYEQESCLGEARRLSQLSNKHIIGFRDVF